MAYDSVLLPNARAYSASCSTLQRAHRTACREASELPFNPALLLRAPSQRLPPRYAPSSPPLHLQQETHIYPVHWPTISTVGPGLSRHAGLTPLHPASISTTPIFLHITPSPAVYPASSPCSVPHKEPEDDPKAEGKRVESLHTSLG